jgi:hypothetical protein
MQQYAEKKTEISTVHLTFRLVRWDPDNDIVFVFPSEREFLSVMLAVDDTRSFYNFVRPSRMDPWDRLLYDELVRGGIFAKLDRPKAKDLSTVQPMDRWQFGRFGALLPTNTFDTFAIRLWKVFQPYKHVFDEKRAKLVNRLFGSRSSLIQLSHDSWNQFLQDPQIQNMFDFKVMETIDDANTFIPLVDAILKDALSDDPKWLSGHLELASAWKHLDDFLVADSTFFKTSQQMCILYMIARLVHHQKRGRFFPTTCPIYFPIPPLNTREGQLWVRVKNAIIVQAMTLERTPAHDKGKNFIAPELESFYARMPEIIRTFDSDIAEYYRLKTWEERVLDFWFWIYFFALQRILRYESPLYFECRRIVKVLCVLRAKYPEEWGNSAAVPPSRSSR